jgi:hypothetical protein
MRPRGVEGILGEGEALHEVAVVGEAPHRRGALEDPPADGVGHTDLATKREAVGAKIEELVLVIGARGQRGRERRSHDRLLRVAREVRDGESGRAQEVPLDAHQRITEAALRA